MMVKLKQVIANKLKSFRAFLEKLSGPATLRLFNKKKKEYEALIERMSSLRGMLEATASDERDFDPDEDERDFDPEEDDTPTTKAPSGDVSSIDISRQVDISQTKGKVKITRRSKLGEQKTLVGNTALALKDFEVPDRKKLASLVSELAQAETALVELEGFLSVLPTKVKSSAQGKAYIKSSKELHKRMDDEAQALSDTLRDLSLKHEPEIMRTIREKAYDFIYKKLPAGTYGQPESDLFISAHDAVTGNANAALQFTCHIYLPMLDMDVYKNGDLTIILTGVVSAKPDSKQYHLELHVTSQNTTDPRELTPGRLRDLGEKMAGNDLDAIISSMKDEIDMLLSMNRLKPQLAHIRFNSRVTKQALRESAILNFPEVVDVDVIGGTEIQVYLKHGTSERQANELFLKIIPILHRIPGMATRRQRGVTKSFIPSTTVDAEGNITLSIIKVKELSGG